VSLPDGVGGWAQFLILLQQRDNAEHHAVGAGIDHGFSWTRAALFFAAGANLLAAIRDGWAWANCSHYPLAKRLMYRSPSNHG
jgi:hypothetical protein